MTAALFTPITFRGLTIPNRIAVSPMCQYASNDGSATDWHLMHIGQFVLGGFGLIIAEMTDVNPVGRISLKCAGLYSDDNEKSLKRIVDFAKQWGPSKHGLQIGHAGRKASTKVPAMGGTPLGKDEGAWETVAPSAIPYDPTWHVPRAMTQDEMKATLADYVVSLLPSRIHSPPPCRASGMSSAAVPMACTAWPTRSGVTRPIPGCWCACMA